MSGKSRITISNIKCVWKIPLFAPLERLITYLSWYVKYTRNGEHSLAIKFGLFFRVQKFGKFSPLQTSTALDDRRRAEKNVFEFRIFFSFMKFKGTGVKVVSSSREFQISILKWPSVGLNFSFHAAIFSGAVELKSFAHSQMSASWECHWEKWIFFYFFNSACCRVLPTTNEQILEN